MKLSKEIIEKLEANGIEVEKAKMKELKNELIEVDADDDFNETEETEILATLKSSNISSVDLDRSFCNRVVSLIENKNARIEELEEKLEQVTLEAYKEFAERLKEKAYKNEHRNYVVLRDDIDNTLKETVGEDND